MSSQEGGSELGNCCEVDCPKALVGRKAQLPQLLMWMGLPTEKAQDKHPEINSAATPIALDALEMKPRGKTIGKANHFCKEKRWWCRVSLG